jgi:hypothetical protein
MKRSLAVEFIFKRLGPIGVSYETCEDVLRTLENIGMLPPEHDPNFIFDLEHVRYAHKWEPEDEEK